MTKLPPPEQWIIKRMNEMELAEMIEQYIDFVDNKGRSVHLPMQFVRHYLQRHRDDTLPTLVAAATLPIVLADGVLLAPEGLDRLRGIEFNIPRELMAEIPKRNECTNEAVRGAMRFLCDQWLCDVATDYPGKCTLIALALTIIERSLLPDRPTFFVTAGRRGGGKTTTIIMLIMAVTGIRPAASAWSTNEEERRKALLSHFLTGAAYILWDNIARGTQISCPHIEKSCTSAYYSDRRLGVSEMVATAASTIHLFTGNNIGPRGDLASRSLHIRLDVDRPDPENREFKHPDPVGWTEDNRGEILRALYTILLGNPTLKIARDAPSKTRFKMWWRIIGSAVEHAANLHGAGPKDAAEVDFQQLFLEQEEDDEESASLADALAAMAEEWPKKKEFKAAEVATIINESSLNQRGATLSEFLFPGAPFGFTATAKSTGKRLKSHLDGPVKGGDRTFVLRAKRKDNELIYHVHVE